MERMESPFMNDPLALVWKAFRRLYPDARVDEIWYDNEDLKDDDGQSVYGYTNFADDGTVQVIVSSNLDLEATTEILAHELAHAAMGTNVGHSREWEEAFTAIHEEFEKIGDEMFGQTEPSELPGNTAEEA